MSEAQLRKVRVWLNDGSANGRFIRTVSQQEAECLVQHRQAAGVKNYKGLWKSIVLAPDASLMPRLGYRLRENTTFSERLDCGHALIQHQPIPGQEPLKQIYRQAFLGVPTSVTTEAGVVDASTVTAYRAEVIRFGQPRPRIRDNQPNPEFEKAA